MAGGCQIRTHLRGIGLSFIKVFFKRNSFNLVYISDQKDDDDEEHVCDHPGHQQQVLVQHRPEQEQ